MCSKFINQCNVAVKHFGTDFYRGCCNGGITRGHGETDWINYGKKEQMRERGRRSMCLKNNEENPKAAGVMWQPMKPPSSEKSAQFCCTYNLYQVCTACSQLLTVFFLHAFNTQTFCKLLYNSATQKHLTHTPLFCRTVLAVLAASFQALTAQRPVFFVAALWPRAVELPIGEGTWKKRKWLQPGQHTFPAFCRHSYKTLLCQ